jgi:hypothetical protein
MIATKDNVLKWAARATDRDLADGYTWYADVRRFCDTLAAEYHMDPDDIAACFSALSPRIPVAINFTACTQMVIAVSRSQGPHALPTIAGIYTNVLKAHAILWSGWNSVDWSKSPKTWAFFQNIIDPNSADVTVDIWAERAAYDDPKFKNTSGLAGELYRNVAQAYIDAADELDIDVAALQAITWISIRGSAN